MWIVYVFTNQVTDKKYVGYTCKGLDVRWAGHKADARHGSPRLFQQAIRRYGQDAFVGKELIQLETELDAKRTEALVIELMGTLAPSGYNQLASWDAPVGNSSQPRAEGKPPMWTIKNMNVARRKRCVAAAQAADLTVAEYVERLVNEDVELAIATLAKTIGIEAAARQVLPGL